MNEAPVGRRRHPVEDGWHLPAGNIIFVGLHGPRKDADQRVDENCEANEHIADIAWCHAGLFENGHENDKAQETQCIDSVDPAEILNESAFEFHHGEFPLFLRNTMFVIKPVLARNEPENQNDEGDLRALASHEIAAGE